MKLVANGIVFVHAVLAITVLSSPILVLITGSLLAGRSIHIFALTAVTLVAWRLCGGCPLTILENKLRRAFDLGGMYEGPCIRHYLKQWLRVSMPGWVPSAMVITALLSSAAILLISKTRSTL